MVGGGGKLDHYPTIKCLILVVTTAPIFMASVMQAQLLVQSVRSVLRSSLSLGTAGARSWSCGWKRVEDGGRVGLLAEQVELQQVVLPLGAVHEPVRGRQ